MLATLNYLLLWKHCDVLRLPMNMRLQQGGCDERLSELESFSKWILCIGDGKVIEPNDGEIEIDIPGVLLIPKCEGPIKELIKEVYGNTLTSKCDHKFSNIEQFLVQQIVM